MRILGIFIVSAALFSCGTAKNQADNIIEEEVVEISENNQILPDDVIKITAEIGAFKESDPFDIDTAYVIDNSLFIHIKYGGGCKDHGFELIGSPVIMKSLPPKRSIQLNHVNPNDMCKAIVSKIIEVDIRNLATEQKSGSQIFFYLKGWKEQLLYTYN